MISFMGPTLSLAEMLGILLDTKYPISGVLNFKVNNDVLTLNEHQGALHFY